MRGRDIKRYDYEFADLYLIATFPSLKIDIEKYPAVKNHLLTFGMKRLEQTGKEYKVNGQTIRARKKTTNKWFETQDSISYWEDFSKQKIIYPDIMRMPRQAELLKEYPYFYFDVKNFYVEATNFIMTGVDIELVFLFLVSDLGFYAFSKFYAGPQFDATGFRYKKVYIDETFIPKPADKQPFLSIMDRLRNGEDVNEQINKIWNEIIDLNPEEIRFVKEYKKNLLV